MDPKNLLNHKTVLVLLFIIALNIISLVLVWRLDVFVNKDLYDFGLMFSLDWANDYWYYTSMLWSFLTGAIALSALSIIPHVQHSRQPNKTTKILTFLLPTLAIIYQTISVFFLWQINDIVQYRLPYFGVPNNLEWSTTYNPIITIALVLMTIALVALIIPALRTLEIIKIEITKED